MLGRPLAVGLAMIVAGTKPHDARRAGLLLTPLGEFSFIIAQLGVGAAVLPPEYYPLAVGVSILTVLATPLVNRHSDAIVRFVERIEPRWLTVATAAYHGWLQQIGTRQGSPIVWRLLRGRFVQIAVEMLIVTGLLIFSGPLFSAFENQIAASGIEDTVLNYTFWSLVGLVVLILLVAIWRNVTAVSMILAESLAADTRLPTPVAYNSLKALAGAAVGYWLYTIVPIGALPAWGWLVIAAAAAAVVAVFSNRLIYWHSTWQSSVQDVFNEEAAHSRDGRTSARMALGQRLGEWDLHLEENEIPDNASYAGCDLAQLAIPSRFGCSVIEVERNGHVITRTGPDLRIYPGDKLLLLGKTEGLAAAREFLQSDRRTPESVDEFGGSVLESYVLPPGAHAGQTLADLRVAAETGVRIVGIQRGDTKIINPGGNQRLEAGDGLLAVGTLAELRDFRRWLKGGPPPAPVASA
jgi:CPA2 family monovalent cation:H+ antiporter-2